ncbi:hypothetical protein EDC01DRAFT_340142 [Geopyxis carbonaria]|nr:hypothetical protein EDC01DRAFT_340142 [Geopyxis carbonaria]
MDSFRDYAQRFILIVFLFVAAYLYIILKHDDSDTEDSDHAISTVLEVATSAREGKRERKTAMAKLETTSEEDSKTREQNTLDTTSEVVSTPDLPTSTGGKMQTVTIPVVKHEKSPNENPKARGQDNSGTNWEAGLAPEVAASMDKTETKPEDYLKTRNRNRSPAQVTDRQAPNPPLKNITNKGPAELPPPKRGILCVRITSIPQSWSKSDLVLFLQTLDEDLIETNYELFLYPAFSSDGNTGILILSVIPKYLQSLGEAKYAPAKEHGLTTTIRFDRRFDGMTPLNGNQAEIKADVVAVTGLAGNAWGSWVNPETRAMWLHDFLPQRVTNARVMTYGYDSLLIGRSANLELTDYRNGFIRALKDCRNECKDRPLILIAHSLGGILVLEALLDSHHNNSTIDIKRHTKGIFLFAVPHQGLKQEGWDELLNHEIEEDADKNDTMKTLVRQLEPGSQFLRIQKEHLMHLWNDFKGSIFTFYETEKTNQPKQQPNGKFERKGAMIKMVDHFSAQLFIPSESRIPVAGANHTNIVKFASDSDHTFITVVNEVSNCIRECARENTKLKSYHKRLYY